MVSPIQSGFQQQFSVNRALNGAASQSNPQDQQTRNPVEEVNDDVIDVTETQNTETNNTASTNSTSELNTVLNSQSNTTFSSTSSDRGNNLDISV